MRNLVVLSAVLIGCKGEEEVEFEPVTFAESAPAGGGTADLSAAAAGALDAHNALWGMMVLAASDTNVQDLMEINGGQSRGGFCWMSTFQGVTATVDYNACQLDGIEGTATMQDTPVGPLVLAFSESFRYGSRSVGGNIGFSAIGGVDYAWQTSSTTPTGQPADAPLIVSIGSTDYEVDLDGHAAIDFLGGQLAGWGTVDITGPDGTQEIIYGSADPAVADMESATPASMKVPFFPACRCMTGGTMALETELTLTNIELPLAQALVDAGTVWPTLNIATDIPLPAKLVLTPSGECGRWSVAVETDVMEVELDGNALRAGVEAGCTGSAFEGPSTCEAARQGAMGVDSLTVEFTQEDLNRMANELMERQIDIGFCTP